MKEAYAVMCVGKMHFFTLNRVLFAHNFNSIKYEKQEFFFFFFSIQKKQREWARSVCYGKWTVLNDANIVRCCEKFYLQLLKSEMGLMRNEATNTRWQLDWIQKTEWSLSVICFTIATQLIERLSQCKVLIMEMANATDGYCAWQRADVAKGVGKNDTDAHCVNLNFKLWMQSFCSSFCRSCSPVEFISRFFSALLQTIYLQSFYFFINSATQFDIMHALKASSGMLKPHICSTFCRLRQEIEMKWLFEQVAQCFLSLQAASLLLSRCSSSELLYYFPPSTSIHFRLQMHSISI